MTASSASPVPAGSIALRQVVALPRGPDGQRMAWTVPPARPRAFSTATRLFSSSTVARATAPVACAAVGAPPPAPAKVNSPLLTLAMIIGLTDPASGVAAPSSTPVPGTITRAPKSWPIDRVHSAAPALLSAATRPGNPPDSVGTGPPGAWPFQPANAAAPAAGGGAT